MIMKEITFNMGRTINTGNYESVRIDVSGAATVAEGEDAEAAMDALQVWVRKQLAAAIPLAKGQK